MAELSLKIDTLTHGPYGLGRRDGRVVMVPLTVPGDRATVRIVLDKGSYAIGELTGLEQSSPARQDPPCRYFGSCGGCSWQHIRHRDQVAAKEKNVVDALQRVGKLSGFEMLPIVSSPREHGYRRRIRLHTREGQRLGYHRALSNEIVEIDSCLIADPAVGARIDSANSWLKALRTRIEYVEIVRGDEERPVVMIGGALERLALEDDAACVRFLEEHDAVQGLILSGPDWRRSWGKDQVVFFSEDDFRIECDAGVFSQVNREANRRLLRELLDWGEFHDQDRLLELYSGAGNFTLPAARRAREVVAVEGHPLAVRDGIENSRRTGLKNIRWLRSHVPQALREMKKRERFSKIVLNPPRTGAKGLADDLASLGAEKILYVSCDPPTLARDLAALVKHGYRLKRVRPFDLFPQTFHVETLAELVR